MKKLLSALIAIVLLSVSACTSMQKSAENLAVDLLRDDSIIYIAIKPQEFDPATTQNLLNFIVPAINKDQRDAIKRIDLIIAGISTAGNNTLSIDAIVKGNFPSLNLLIKLDKSGNWKKIKDSWYNVSNHYYISEPSPGVFLIRSNSLAQAATTKDKAKLANFIAFLTSKSLSIGIYSLKDFSKTILNTTNDELAIQTIFSSFTKNQNTYDFSLTLGYTDKKVAEENMLLSRTIVFITITTMFQSNASKIISKLEWSIDDEGHATCTYKGLTLNEIYTIINSTSGDSLQNILNNQ